MFLKPEELLSAIEEYQVEDITGKEVDNATVRSAILAAIDEAVSYLNGKYDCDAIFNATGDKRNTLVLEHCKSIAIWYLLKKSNTDIIFDRAKEYYHAAIDWFKRVAGTGSGGGTLAPNLPLKTENGEVKLKSRFGSRPKFTHEF